MKFRTVNRFQRLRHIQPNLDILFGKLTAQKGDLICKTPSAHYTSGFGDFMESLPSFLSIFNVDQYFDSLIVEIFKI